MKTNPRVLFCIPLLLLLAISPLVLSARANSSQVGNNLPAFKNQFEYFVDHDWNLPIGYLYFNTGADQNMPPLKIAMWFRGEL